MAMVVHNGGHRRNGPGRLEDHHSVLHACGGNQEAAKEILKLLDDSLESGVLDVPRSRCLEWLVPLEEAEGEREGKDRGAHRLLKAITVMLRLKGFNNRDYMLPIKELDFTGHHLLSFSVPSRAPGTREQKAEPVIRSLEAAVHLARASSSVVVVKLGDCRIGPEGGDKCLAEVVRLVRRMGIGFQTRFLEEVDLHGNLLDAESVRKIVEAAVKERCERSKEVPPVPLWLDLSGNRVRNAATVFQNLQAWAGWAHDCEGALCLADEEGCSRQACAHRCMLHMPKFTDQSRPEAAKTQDADEAVSISATSAVPVTESSAIAKVSGRPAVAHRISPVRRRPGPRPPLQPLRTAPAWRRSRSRRRPVRSPPRLTLKPGPGAWEEFKRSRSRSRRNRSRRRRSLQMRSRKKSAGAYHSRSCSRRRSPGKRKYSSQGRRASPSLEHGRRLCEASERSDCGASRSPSPASSAAEPSSVESEVDGSPEVESDAKSEEESCGGSTENTCPSGPDCVSADAEGSLSDGGSASGSQSPSPVPETRTSSVAPESHELGHRLDRLLESLKSTARGATGKKPRGPPQCRSC